MLFVFSSLSEFAVIKFMSYQFKKRIYKLRNEKRRTEEFGKKFSQADRFKLSSLVLEQQTTIDRIEMIARYLFPVMFGIWCAIYWPMLLMRKF